MLQLESKEEDVQSKEQSSSSRRSSSTVFICILISSTIFCLHFKKYRDFLPFITHVNAHTFTQAKKAIEIYDLKS